MQPHFMLKHFLPYTFFGGKSKYTLHCDLLILRLANHFSEKTKKLLLVFDIWLCPAQIKNPQIFHVLIVLPMHCNKQLQKYLLFHTGFKYCVTKLQLGKQLTKTALFGLFGCALNENATSISFTQAFVVFLRYFDTISSKPKYNV